MDMIWDQDKLGSKGIRSVDCAEKMDSQKPNGSRLIVPNNLCYVYREIAEVIGSAGAEQMWRLFRGQTVEFPQRLFSREAVRNYISENMTEMTPKELAREVELTDRRVRQIIKEIKSNNSNT